MTRSGKSLFYFGIYVVITGLLFIIIPENLISLLHLPEMPTGWARVVGLLALVIGTNDIYFGKTNQQSFIKASIFIRLGFALGATLLVVFKEMPATVILFGAVDALGSLWTAIAPESVRGRT